MRLLIERLAALTEKTEDLINDPTHKPKALAKAFVQALKPLGKVTVAKAEATMPQGWDYGFIGDFVVPTKQHGPVTVSMVLRFAKDAINGQASERDSGVIESARNMKKVEDVIRRLTTSVVSHFTPRESDE